jgi:hypothetical protein
MAFNFESLRVTEIAPIVTKRIVTSIPIKKPKSGVEFFRIRPEPEWQFVTYMLDIGGKGEGEGKYLLVPELYPEVVETKKLKPVMIYTGISFGTSELFISEIALPTPDGEDNEYNRTRRIAYQMAMEKWVKLQTDEGSYSTVLAVSNLPEPVYPTEPENIQKVLEIAFKDKLIESRDHPVLKKLRGEL